MELTVDEINTCIEALDAWTTAAKSSALLGAVLFGGMLGGEAGKELAKSLMAGEDEKATLRKETAALIKAKLIRIRDTMIAKQAAVFAQ